MRSRSSFVACASIAALCCGGGDAVQPEAVPAALVVVGGDGQVRFPGLDLANKMTVGLVDADGELAEVSGIGVSWRVLEGGGSLQIDADTTDATGRARATFTLGPLGEQRVEASVEGIGTVPFTARSVDPGPIVFVSNRRFGVPGDQFRDAPGDLYSMKTDGTDVVYLGERSDPLDWVGRPAWSPDGNKILFQRDLSSIAQGVFVVEANGTRKIRVPVVDDPWYVAFFREPAWSPDARSIVAHNTADGQLYRMSAQGGGVSRLSDHIGASRTPNWHPTADTLAYACMSGSVGSICVVAADGTGWRRLTAGADDAEPDWSPDGTQILFSRSAGADSTGIWIVNRDGSGERMVFNDLASSPSWSPDGNAFVATVDQRSGQDIYLVDLATADAANLTNSITLDRDAVWRRD